MGFQSLFQWIPVLYMFRALKLTPSDGSFNPYFSGFRSYTFRSQFLWRSLSMVSILISVDSGLILDAISIEEFEQSCFNPYFSGFRSYT
mgnify:CR=1 FL=1